MGAFQMAPKNQTGDSLKNGSESFNKIVVIYGNHFPK
jgi:hypothetical protein